MAEVRAILTGYKTRIEGEGEFADMLSGAVSSLFTFVIQNRIGTILLHRHFVQELTHEQLFVDDALPLIVPYIPFAGMHPHGLLRFNDLSLSDA